MGWFWNSSAPAKPAAPQDPALSQAPAQQPPQASSAPDEDVEVTKFLQEVMGEVNSMRNSIDSKSTSKEPTSESSPSSSTNPSWSSRWRITPFSTPSSQTTSPSSLPATSSTTTEDIQAQSSSNEERLSPLAESLLPTTMDCEQAFNLAFYCQSLGGQWNSLYRYGSVRSCSENWNDFWFCMRVKGYQAGKVKDDMIREYYRKKELAKYGPGKPSSEDVWRERRERVKPGEAFAEPVDAPPSMNDAEYQRLEMERMERIRHELKNEA